MAASFPTSPKSFTTRVAGDTIQPGHVNDLQDEVTAIETQLLTTNSYTPTWSNSGTANSIGNGSITGNYVKHGKLVHFRATITWGSTTTSGDGFWILSLPSTADSFTMGGGCSGLAFDTSTGSFYAITCTNNNTGSVILAGIASPIAGVTATSPMTWATGDALSIVGWYIEA